MTDPALRVTLTTEATTATQAPITAEIAILAITAAQAPITAEIATLAIIATQAPITAAIAILATTATQDPITAETLLNHLVETRAITVARRGVEMVIINSLKTPQLPMTMHIHRLWIHKLLHQCTPVTPKPHMPRNPSLPILRPLPPTSARQQPPMLAVITRHRHMQEIAKLL
jgi:hypothetical protein